MGERCFCLFPALHPGESRCLQDRPITHMFHFVLIVFTTVGELTRGQATWSCGIMEQTSTGPHLIPKQYANTAPMTEDRRTDRLRYNCSLSEAMPEN